MTKDKLFIDFQTIKKATKYRAIAFLSGVFAGVYYERL